jgi:predicted DNA-binding antitoxin AbrB/MazE fold protein
MTIIRAVYDGKVFIPKKPCKIASGSEVTLIIETANKVFSKKQKKLAAFKKLTNEIIELNKTDPLPPEFDLILSQRLRFREFSGWADIV